MRSKVRDPLPSKVQKGSKTVRVLHTFPTLEITYVIFIVQQSTCQSNPQYHDFLKLYRDIPNTYTGTHNHPSKLFKCKNVLFALIPSTSRFQTVSPLLHVSKLISCTRTSMPQRIHNFHYFPCLFYPVNLSDYFICIFVLSIFILFFPF